MKTKRHKERDLYDTATAVIAIDPGLDGTGWAVWTNDAQNEAPAVPTGCGTLRAPKDKDMTLTDRCQALWEKLRDDLCDADVGLPMIPFNRHTYVFLELPTHFASSARGIAAQGGGSIYYLTYLVGFLGAKLSQCTVILFTPNEWKGQLPKDVVQRRVTRFLGTETCEELGIKTHAWDAVGMGLSVMGRIDT